MWLAFFQSNDIYYERNVPAAGAGGDIVCSHDHGPRWHMAAGYLAVANIFDRQNASGLSGHEWWSVSSRAAPWSDKRLNLAKWSLTGTESCVVSSARHSGRNVKGLCVEKRYKMSALLLLRLFILELLSKFAALNCIYRIFPSQRPIVFPYFQNTLMFLLADDLHEQLTVFSTETWCQSSTQEKQISIFPKKSNFYFKFCKNIFSLNRLRLPYVC